MEHTLSEPRYVLVAPVPRSLEVRIEDAFLSLIGTSRPIAGFHISLLGPFLWDGPPQEGVFTQVEALCQNWPPFEVSIGGLDAFPGEESTAVYITIVDQEPLRRLHRAVHALFRPYIVLQREFPPEGYLPHITLGLGLNAAERDRILAGGNGEQMAATFPVTEVRLLEEQPNVPWRSTRVFPLEGHGQETRYL